MKIHIGFCENTKKALKVTKEVFDSKIVKEVWFNGARLESVGEVTATYREDNCGGWIEVRSGGNRICILESEDLFEFQHGDISHRESENGLKELIYWGCENRTNGVSELSIYF